MKRMREIVTICARAAKLVTNTRVFSPWGENKRVCVESDTFRFAIHQSMLHLCTYIWYIEVYCKYCRVDIKSIDTKMGNLREGLKEGPQGERERERGEWEKKSKGMGKIEGMGYARGEKEERKMQGGWRGEGGVWRKEGWRAGRKKKKRIEGRMEETNLPILLMR